MQIKDLQFKKVAILGLGVEGLATLKYLIKHGVKPSLFDYQKIEVWNSDINELIAGHNLEAYSGEDYLSSLPSMEVVFRSPGIPLSNEYLQQALQSGAVITSQTKWFFEHNTSPVIGITGTKGKGTTSSLIYEVLLAAMPDSLIYFTGNIGKVQPFDFVDELTGSEIIVYELSSFQLQDLDKSPHIGVCLMVTADHLDHHKTLSDYHLAKSAISKYQLSSDTCVYNQDYTATKYIGQQGQGDKLIVSSLNAPTDGVLIERDLLHVYQNNLKIKTLDCSTRLLKGQHNMENIAAAYLAVQSYDVSDEQFLESLQSFKGLEHRLEFVAEVEGIKYYNDSISTVPDTCIAAINAFETPLHLILGGSSKGIAMDALANKILTQKNIKTVALMGEVGHELEKLLVDGGFEGTIIGPSYNFNELFNQCSKQATSGDVVLMSPAATSFGMFKNYSERGRVFKTLVGNISNAEKE